jgi:hypothetical protein
MLVQDEVGNRDAVVAAIRQTMLDALDELSIPDARALDNKISNTGDITGLWNLRTELTNVIAVEKGSEAARTRVNSITDMFGKY